MADLKIDAPDTTSDINGFVFGGDSQASGSPSIYPTSDFLANARASRGFLYAFDPAFEVDSLAHNPKPKLKQLYNYSYWDSLRVGATSGLARCISLSGDVNPVGTVVYAAGGTQVGMILTGVGGATYHLIPQTERYSLGSFGVDMTAANSGQKARIESIVSDAYARKGVIAGAGAIAVNQSLIFNQAFVDLTNVTLKARETFLGSIATAGGPTVNSAIGAPIEQSFNVEGYDAGGDTFTFDPVTQSFSFTVPKNAIGVTVDNLNTGASKVTARVLRAGFGVVIKGNTEKTTIEAYINDTEVGIIESIAEHAIESITLGNPTIIKTKRTHPFIDGDTVMFNGVGGLTAINGQRYTVNTQIDRHTFGIGYNSTGGNAFTSGGYVREHRASNSSPDSNRITANMQRVFQALRTGGDGTMFADLVVEARRDPGWWIEAAYNPSILIPLPMVEIKSGKNPRVDLNCRGNDGRLGVYVDRDSLTNGNDRTTINITSNDEFKGTVLLVDRANEVQGTVTAFDTLNGQMYWPGFTPGVSWPMPPVYPCPTVQINEVRASFNVEINIPHCAAREGVRLGDVTKGLFSQDIQFKPMQVVMNGPETSQGNAFNRKTGLYPTNKTAFVIEKATRCYIPFKEIHGNIDLMAGCLDNTIVVPAEWMLRNYTITMDPAATATLIIKGPISSSRLFGRSWQNANLKVVAESVTDFGGAPAWFDGTKWNIGSAFGAEEIRDLVAGFIQPGTGTTVVHNDLEDTLVINSTSAPSPWEGNLPDSVVPAAPSSGLKVFTETKAGKRRLGIRAPASAHKAMQSSIADNKVRLWAATGNGALTTSIGLTLTQGNTPVARPVANTNDFTMFTRQGHVAASAAAGQGFSLRAQNLMFARANAVGGKNAGFDAIFRFGIAIADANLGRYFVGMTASVNAHNNNNAVDSNLNIIGICKEDGDANFSVIHNDGAGTATKIPLGSSFPANTSSLDMYELRLYCAPNGTGIGYYVENLVTGASVEGFITTDIPAPTQLLAPQFHGSTGTSTTILGFDLVSLYIESDY